MDQIAALTARVDELEDIIQEIRTALAPRQIFRSDLPLSRFEEIILDALSNGEFWSVDRLLARLEVARPSTEGRNANSIRTLVYRLRRKLMCVTPPIEIRVQNDVGYVIPKADIVRLLAMKEETK